MGVASRVQKTFKMQLLSLLPLLCIVSAAPEGGLFGFGLLGGDSTSNNTTTTTAPTTTTTASPATTTALVEALTSTTAESSRTWSTFLPARLQPSPLTSCPASWALTTRFHLHSATPLVSSRTPSSAQSFWLL